ncbi:YxlC family protein [Terribacillus saccharophilus]|uniref:YxlC family protein n=1 Tax=Terribacillus saccharophilus TaxID=361277 RepID=UPI003981FE72
MKQDDWIKKMDETWNDMDGKLHVEVPDTDEIMQQVNSGEKRFLEKMRKDLYRFIILAIVLMSLYILVAVHITWAFYVVQFISLIAVVILLLAERSKGKII